MLNVPSRSLLNASLQWYHNDIAKLHKLKLISESIFNYHENVSKFDYPKLAMYDIVITLYLGEKGII